MLKIITEISAINNVLIYIYIYVYTLRFILGVCLVLYYLFCITSLNELI